MHPEPGTLVIREHNPKKEKRRDNICFILDGSVAASDQVQIEVDPNSGYPLKPTVDAQTKSQITVYHINDLHGHLTRIGPNGDMSFLSHLSGAVLQSRESKQSQSTEGVLVLSAGDDCAGSIFDEMAFIQDTQLPAHPCYHLYSKIGFDAIALGNHDFDLGLERLAQFIREYADYPVLAANLDCQSQYQEVIHPGAIILAGGVRIGIIGLVTRAESRLNPEQGRILEPLPIAQKMVSALEPYCDLVFILSHLGYDLGENQVPMKDAGDVQLAKSLPHRSVDLLVGGHSHSILNLGGISPRNQINGIQIVQAGMGGEFIGKVEIQFKDGESEILNVDLLEPQQMPVDSILQNNEIDPLLAWSRDLLSRHLGAIDPQLQASPEEVRWGFQTGEYALSNFICDALFEQLSGQGYEVDFVMLDISSIQCGFQDASWVTFEDCFEVMPFLDTVRFYRLTGSQLIKLLQDNARRLGCQEDTQDQRGFLQFSKHIRYTIHEGDTPDNNHLADATWQGKTIEDLEGRTFTAAATCFTRVLSTVWEEGNMATPLLLDSFPFQDTQLILRHEVISYLTDLIKTTDNNLTLVDGRLTVLQGQ